MKIDQDMSLDTLFVRHHDIMMARIKKQRELMDDYDETVYRPALKSLQDECANIGHTPSPHVKDNGLGFFWKLCSKCGATIPIRSN